MPARWVRHLSVVTPAPQPRPFDQHGTGQQWLALPIHQQERLVQELGGLVDAGLLPGAAGPQQQVDPVLG